MVMASSGHSPRQAPRPSQYLSLTSFAFPSTIRRAPSAHADTQTPHPVHFSSSMRTTFLTPSLPLPCCCSFLATHPMVYGGWASLDSLALTLSLQLPPPLLSQTLPS